VIGGVIIGLVLFASFFQIMSIIVANKEQEAAKQNIDELASIASSFCEMGSGRSMSKKFTLPNAANSIFVSDDQRTASFRDNISYGQYLCINTTASHDVYCVKSNCALELAFNTTSKTIGSMLNRLLGRYDYTEYSLNILRTSCGVALLAENETSKASGCECDHNPLMKCKNNVVAAYIDPNLVLLADFTPIYDCCNDTTLRFLKNTAEFLKGRNILIVWEGLSFGPKLPENTLILNILGYNFSSFRHTKTITSSLLQDYDQVWVFVPGFCSVFDEQGRTLECKDVIGWSRDEVKEIGDFVGRGGKLLLVSDYTPYTTQSVVNDILMQSGYSSKFSDGCFCGCKGVEEKATEMISHKITEGITDWIVKSSAKITC